MRSPCAGLLVHPRISHLPYRFPFTSPRLPTLIGLSGHPFQHLRVSPRSASNAIHPGMSSHFLRLTIGRLGRPLMRVQVPRKSRWGGGGGCDGMMNERARAVHSRSKIEMCERGGLVRPQTAMGVRGGSRSVGRASSLSLSLSLELARSCLARHGSSRQVSKQLAEAGRTLRVYLRPREHRTDPREWKSPFKYVLKSITFARFLSHVAYGIGVQHTASANGNKPLNGKNKNCKP